MSEDGRDYLECKTISCPCCGEWIEVLIDCSVPMQVYIEDCQVCCRPMVLSVTVDATGGVDVAAADENAC